MLVFSKQGTNKEPVPCPDFGGSTGGWLPSTIMEELYMISWKSSSYQVFEMPISGSAIMQEGINILYLSKKEQCLTHASNLRDMFGITNYRIYRRHKDDDLQYIHPKDGVFPEKVNRGRLPIGYFNRPMWTNDEPHLIKFVKSDIF